MTSEWGRDQKDVTTQLFETLDQAKVSSFHRRVVILAALGPFSDAFNEFGVSASLVAVGILFHLSPILLSVVVASYWVGVAAGGFLGGIISDLIGRRTLFIYDTLGMALFAILSSLSFNGIFYFIMRMLLGFFIGLDYAAAVPLVSEYAPPQIRGELLSIEKVFFKLGGLTTIGLSLLLAVTVSPLIAWRIDFLAAAIVPLILFFLRKNIPESLRWAIDVGDINKAKSIAEYLKKFGFKINENILNSMIIANQKFSYKELLKEFFSSKNRKVLLYIFWISSGYALTVNLASVYGTRIFQLLGATATESLAATLISAFFGLFGIILMLFIVDKIGRKITGILGFILTMFSSLLFLIPYILHSITIPIAILAIGLIYFFDVGLVGTLMYIPSVELTMSRVRGTTIGWDKLFEFGLALPALTLYAYLGLKYSFILEIILSAIFALGTWILSIDVTGKSLEEAVKIAWGTKI
ncbi:MAG: MFS transporter [Thermoproteota archaeon]